MHNKRLRDRRLRNKGLKDDEDPLVCEDVASDNEWFIDDETDLPLSDLQLEDLSVDVLRGEADQGGVSTSATPHTSTSSAAKDVEGDRIFGIRSFSVRLGQKPVFWTCVCLLEMAYAVAIVTGVTSTCLWSKFPTVLGHAVLALILWNNARSVSLTSKAAITSFYMFIWKLFYAESVSLQEETKNSFLAGSNNQVTKDEAVKPQGIVGDPYNAKG
ncbi:hypothetical protein M5K25_009280 [Dendrobium thyrsiflorum]|uniref:Uncharacterized protein n=1 Tax=Dendrobium thyrsiflorum TaxID=117978 RepID=A0ABD0V5E9_DENTH